MEYHPLGTTGMEVSPVCLGTSRLVVEQDADSELPVSTREDAFEVLSAAWDHGVNFIDTANIYGRPRGRSETVLGEWLTEHDREQFVIATKVQGQLYDGPNGGGLSRKHIHRAVEDSLARLGTEYIDVYYLHWWDESVPLETTLAALNALVREGKVHHIGVSNFSAWQLLEAVRICERHDWVMPTVVQPEYNAIKRIPQLLAVCEREEIAICGYRPLAAGFLTGKYSRTDDPPAASRGARSDRVGAFADDEWAVLDTVETVADAVGATPAQVALAWARQAPACDAVPIVGVRTTDQLEENIGAATLTLSHDQVAEITAVLEDRE